MKIYYKGFENEYRITHNGARTEWWVEKKVKFLFIKHWVRHSFSCSNRKRAEEILKELIK